MKNSENQMMTNQLSEKAKEIGKKNTLVENAEHLGLDHVEKQKMIESADKINEELDFLEKISGLNSEEVELIYTNLSHEEALVETKHFLDNVTDEEKENILKQGVKNFVDIARKYVNPKQLIIVTVGFMLLTSSAYGKDRINIGDISDSDFTVDVTELINSHFDNDVEKNNFDKKIEKMAELSEDQKENIVNVIIPKISDKFKDSLGVRNAEIAILSQRSVGHKNGGYPELIMAFFDEPQKSEFLEDYLIRQAQRGVLSEMDVDVLYEYFTFGKIIAY